MCAALQEYAKIVEPRIRDLLLSYGQMSASDPFFLDKLRPFVEAIGCLENANLLRL